MPQATWEGWREACLAILGDIHAIRSGRGRTVEGAPSYEVAAFDRFFAKATGGVLVPETWSRRYQDALAARGERTPFRDGPYENERLEDMRVMRLGHARLTGDGAWVAPAEAASLAGSGLPPPRRDAPPPQEEGDAFVATFCAPYPLLPGRARTMTVPCRGRSVFVASRIDVASTQRAYALGFAGRDEAVDVVRHEGVLYRPVLAPGTLRGATEAEFAAAASGDDAWADSPFLNAGAQRKVPLSDYAREAPPGNDGDVARMEAAMADASRRCGRLLSVEGIVHRQTPPPEFFVTWQYEPRDHRACLDWRLGELTSRFAPGPFCRVDHRCDWAFGCGMSHMHVGAMAAHAYAHEEMAVARDVLAMVAKTFADRTSEAAIWPPVGDPGDPSYAMERRLRAFLAHCGDAEQGRRTFGASGYGAALRKACRAMANRDVEAMRSAFSMLPRPDPARVNDRAEYAYLRAVMGASGRALKGDYGADEGSDLDLSMI